MSDSVTEALRLYGESLDATREQRKQIEDDLAFSDPSDPQQWDDQERMSREQDPGGARPCLTFDQLGQYISNVSGQVETRPPSLHALPAGGGSDKKVAEHLDGVFRHIEYASRAPSEHYPSSMLSSARAGVGYLIVRPEYVDRALGYQEPRISSEPDPLRVVLDPWSIRLDGSDADFGWLLTPYSKRAFGRKWPGKDAVSFDTAQTMVSDDRESIVVAEQWMVDEVTKLMVICIDPEGLEYSMPAEDARKSIEGGMQLQIIGEFKDKARRVMWSRLSGAEELEKAEEYPACNIGIVPVYGYVGYADGRLKYCGIARRGRDAQKAYNYHQSEIRAYMAQAPKSPWIAPASAVGPYKNMWDRASIESRAFLPYEDWDAENGRPIAAPSRAPLAMNLQNHVLAAEQALTSIQASIGMYQANLGAPSNESSGVAIESRKQQGEASTSHFQSHLALSIAACGRIVLDMLPKLVDTKRQMRILGFDGSPGDVQVDPKQQQPMQQADDGTITINPTIGKYDVRVVVGASFSTQRTQAQAAFSEMMRNNPAMTPAIAPLWAKTLDVADSDKLAQVLTAMAPPAVKAVLQPAGGKDAGPSAAQLAQQLEQVKQALQEAIQHGQEAQKDADEAIAGIAEEKRLAAVRERELNIKAYEAETNRLKITGANELQMQAIVRDLITQMLESPDPLPGDPVAEQGEAPESNEMPGMEREPIEGQGPDGGAMHEGMEGEAPEPADESMGAMPAMPAQGEVM
jgi:hypothetical protein